MNTTTSSETRPTSTPDATGDCGEQDDTRHLGPDTDDHGTEESGYGYGV